MGFDLRDKSCEQHCIVDWKLSHVPRRHQRDDRWQAGLSLHVSPTQVNVQVPADAATGSVSVVVTTANGAATSTVTLAQFAPSFFLLDAKHVAGIIPRSDGSGAYAGGSYDILGPTGSSLGYATVAAKAGDVVELYGTGFGPTSPAVAPGQVFSGAAPTTNPVQLLINNVGVTPSFAGAIRRWAGPDQSDRCHPALAQATFRSLQPSAARKRPRAW